MEIRACREEELVKVINLINKVFRDSRGLEPTMEKEFLLLLSKNNIQNMIIAVEDNNPAAAVNFYKSDILIQGTPIKAASVGAVCTDENYRGRNIASDVLDEVEKRMVNEGVRVMLISGERSLYTRRGAVQVCPTYFFKIDSAEETGDIEVVEFNSNMLQDMIKLYNNEVTRYYRTFEEFKKLLKGASVGFENNDFKTYGVYSKGVLKAYIFVGRQKGEENIGFIREMAGDRVLIKKAFSQIMKKFDLSKLEIPCIWNEPMAEELKGYEINYELKNLGGTVKVLDFVGLMKDLKPYFAQYIDKENLDKLQFEVLNGKYIFKFEEEELIIESVDELTKFIFGSVESNIDLNKLSKLKDILSKIFPIPFVNTHNLNYQ